MSDYISKSAIVDRLSEEAKRLAEIAIHSKGQAADYYTGRKTGMARAAIIATCFPTIDAAPVVRCKDCKYYREGRVLSPQKFCFRLRGRDGKAIGYNFADDDFCSYGERSEDGET